MFFLDELPRRFVLLGAIGSGEVEEELIRVGGGQEVAAIGEGLDFIELLFHEVVDGLDVGLEAVLSGRDGAMDLTWNALDGVGEGGVGLGLPAPTNSAPLSDCQVAAERSAPQACRCWMMRSAKTVA